jgi:hypothetical protein
MPQSMDAREEAALRRAVAILECQSFVGRLTALTGEPLTQLLKRLPAPLTGQINRAVRSALMQALDVALYRMGATGIPEPPLLFQFASTVTGGVGGFFGIGGLALELPVTTTLMLRSIAGIAARYGERLDRPAARLACLEVFALEPHNKPHVGVSGEAGYYAARAFLARSVSQAAQNLLERGVAGTSAPVIVDVVAAVGSRFGIVVSERVAASSIPVVGAIGGAAINLAFMQHFQQLARAHFLIRRLERRYGVQVIRDRYHGYEQARNARI